MLNENDIRLIERLMKRNHRRRLMKRGLALVSALVLLWTMNTLKLRVIALEHTPTCGCDYEHIHGAECFDEAGNLICALHEHTDACFQEAPIPEEMEVDLDAFEDDELIDMDDAQTPMGADAGEIPEEQTAFEFDMAGQARVTLSELLALTGLTVDRADIQMVGLVDDEQLGNDPIAVALVDQDIAITALRAFDAVEIAIVTGDNIFTVTLLNGAPEAAEAPAEDAVEDAEESAEKDAGENDEEIIEENGEEIVEEIGEQDLEAVAEEIGEEIIEKNVEENIEEKIEENVEEAVEEGEGDAVEVSAEALEEPTEVEGIDEEAEQEEQTEVENIETEQTAEERTEEEAAEQVEEEKAEEEATEQVEEEKAEETEEAATEVTTEEEATEETSEESEEEKSEEEKAEETGEESGEEKPESEAVEQVEEDKTEEVTEEKTEEVTEEESEEVTEEESEEEKTEEEATEQVEEEKAEETAEEATAGEKAEAEATEEAEAVEATEEAPEEATEETPEMTSEESTEETPEMTPEEMLAALYPAQVFEAYADNVRVNVTAEVGAFPANTEMRVTPVWDADKLDGIAGTVAEEFVEVKKVLAVDIAFFNADGEEIEPLLPISVVMTVEEIAENQDAVVVHMDDDGNTEVVEQAEAVLADAAQLALNVELPAAENAEVLTEQALAEAAEAVIDETAIEGDAEALTEQALAEAAEAVIDENATEDDAEAVIDETAIEGDAEAASDEIETESAADEPETGDAMSADAVEAAPDEPATVEYGSEVEAPAPAPVAEALVVETESVAFEADAFSVYAVVVTETIETRYIAADGASFNITVGYGPEAEIPAGAELAVREIAEGEEYERYMSQSAEVIAASGVTDAVAAARFFDIEIVSGGEKVEPAAPVEVNICYDSALELADDAGLSVVHFADDGTEVIHDVELSADGTRITYQQASFSVTGTVVHTPVTEHCYAMVIRHEGQYYVVEHDGTLTRIKDEDLVFNGDGSVRTVKMVNPICWTYADIGYGNYNIYHNTNARSFDWHPERPAGQQGSSLPTAYTRRYLTVDRDGGLGDENDDVNPWNVDGQYLNLQYNSDTHRINHYDRCLGVTTDGDGTLRIKGNSSWDDAAEVYFAEAQQVLDVNVKNHTVNHIDISVVGKAGIKVPLAYDTYKLARLDDIANANADDLNSHITGYRDENLIVSPLNEVRLEVERTVPVTTDDIKKADIHAFTTWKNSTEYLDDVYNVIGYSNNAETNDNQPQVRLEGRFKVSDLAPLPDSYYNEDAANNWNYPGTNKPVKTMRLERPIYYSVAVTKPVTFTMTYTDPQTKETFVVCDADGNPIRKTVDVTLASSFSYWDDENECPALYLYNLYGSETETDPNSKWRWSQGEMSSNSNWNNKVRSETGESALDGGPGMDFRLGVELNGTTEDKVHIEVHKYVQGDFGTEVRMLTLDKGTECAVDVFQNDSDSAKHRLTIPVGRDGMGTLVDWDVEGAASYDDPAKEARISEVPSSVEDELVDGEGRRWVYARTRVETEVDELMGDGHVAQYDSGESLQYTKADDAFDSASEKLGRYADNGTHRFNPCLEYFIYNIYQPKTYPVKIKKVNATNPLDDTGLEGAEFDLYGPYTDAEVNGAGFDPKQSERKWNADTITTDGDGLVEVMNLASGHYYLVETKAPDGFNMMTTPVVFSIDSRRETNGESPITYAPDANTLSDVSQGLKLEGDTFILIVTNNPGARLPSTGGAGTGAYTLAGGALALLALALLLAKRREA